MSISPVTGAKSKIVDTFKVKEVLRLYKEIYNLDVSNYFINMDELNLYQCPDTDVKFFYPYNLAGDEIFYKALEDYPFYYSNWKYEYEEAFGVINANSKVLDIGCGRGAFIDKLKKEKNCEVYGLEFNPSALDLMRKNGIPCESSFIEEFSKTNKGKFDYVCAFQVLEHIGKVNSFIANAIECIKPNGKLIIAVPYNKPYLFGVKKYECLNLPPHHMGWWNDISLTKLGEHFNLKVDTIRTKPFKDYNSYLNALESDAAIENPNKLWWLKLTRPLRKQWIQIFKNKIPGQEIFIIYTKK